MKIQNSITNVQSFPSPSSNERPCEYTDLQQQMMNMKNKNSSAYISGTEDEEIVEID